MNVNAINAVQNKSYAAPKSKVVNNAQSDIKPAYKYNALDKMGALGMSMVQPKKSMAVSFTGWSP
ncbi:hypothetical protein IJ707_06040 [bacterium]|nr:hypothetical protein [bacterium]